MKILHVVEFYQPSVGGMQEVVKQISERLTKLGHDVTVATTYLPERTSSVINGVKIVGFKVSGNLAKGLVGDVEIYRNFLLESDFDIVTCFAAQQWSTDALLSILNEIKSKKVFVPTGFSGLYLPEYKEYYESMKIWMKQYDMNIFLSNDYRDINFARQIGIEKIELIPNGAAADEFSLDSKVDIRNLLGISPDNYLILHVGSHTGLKGHAEAIKIFHFAHINNATLLIVANEQEGGCSEKCKLKEKIFNLLPHRLLDKKRLIVRSLPREETVSAYKQADLFLFPSNIECSPLVLFECLASATPFLTTDAGNSAEIIDWSKGGRLLTTTKDENGYSKASISRAARELEKIYADPEAQNAMKLAGFSAWFEKFTWEKISKDYENLYLSLMR